MTKNKIELKDVTYIYGTGTPYQRTALDHVSVAFEEGVTTGLIGHTGSGKSTMVQLFNGLLRPTEGQVLLDGADIWARPKEIRSIRFRVGLVMQYPEYQLFDETVRSDIGFGPRNMGLSDGEVADRVREAAQFVSLPEELLDKSPFDLSGGQKRRAAIAGVLAMRPEVLVLDEPAAGLDPRGRREILGGLSRYRSENHATVILVSHSMEDMAHYCDRVIVMNQARVYATGSVAEIFSRAQDLADVNLDVPQISKIALALRQRGIMLEGDLYTVEAMYHAVLRYLGREGKA